MDSLTEFLLGSSSSGVTKAQLNCMAEKVASSFVCDGIPLHSGVVAAATDNKLNEEQTRRVAEMANRVTDTMLRAKYAGHRGNIEFELVDPCKVVCQVRRPTPPATRYPVMPTEKVANLQLEKSDTDCFSSRDLVANDLLLSTIFGIDESALEKSDTLSKKEKVAASRDELEEAKHALSIYNETKNKLALMFEKVASIMDSALKSGEEPTEILAVMQISGLSDTAISNLTEGYEADFISPVVAIPKYAEVNTESDLYRYGNYLAELEDRLLNVGRYIMSKEAPEFSLQLQDVKNSL